MAVSAVCLPHVVASAAAAVFVHYSTRAAAAAAAVGWYPFLRVAFQRPDSGYPELAVAEP
jgi:uncharacterized membrane protein YbjE (DUF340 family)